MVNDLFLVTFFLEKYLGKLDLLLQYTPMTCPFYFNPRVIITIIIIIIIIINKNVM